MRCSLDPFFKPYVFCHIPVWIGDKWKDRYPERGDMRIRWPQRWRRGLQGIPETDPMDTVFIVSSSCCCPASAAPEWRPHSPLPPSASTATFLGQTHRADRRWWNAGNTPLFHVRDTVCSGNITTGAMSLSSLIVSTPSAIMFPHRFHFRYWFMCANSIKLNHLLRDKISVRFLRHFHVIL